MYMYVYTYTSGASASKGNIVDGRCGNIISWIRSHNCVK